MFDDLKLYSILLPLMFGLIILTIVISCVIMIIKNTNKKKDISLKGQLLLTELMVKNYKKNKENFDKNSNKENLNINTDNLVKNIDKTNQDEINKNND